MMLAKLLHFSGPTRVERPTVRAETADDPPAMVEVAEEHFAEVEAFGASVAKEAEAERDRPLDTERQRVRDRIAARMGERAKVEKLMADLIGQAEQQRELIAQYDAMNAGEAAYLASLDAYQPAQMAAE